MPAPQRSASPLVRLRHVSQLADGLRDLSLEVMEGEILALLGPRGAGKTALLRLLAGFARPDSGEILLQERRLARTPPPRRPIGLMAREFPLFAHLTLAENLALPLDIRGIPRAARTGLVARALDLLRLTGLAERRPATLAELQRRQAMLARAVAFEPRLLLLDAPLDGLDPPSHAALRQDIIRLRDQLGLTVLHATADAADAFALAERIAVLAAGQLRQIGLPQALYDAPADAFTAGLLGENNRLPGHAEAIEDDIAVVRLACGPTVEARIADAREGEPCEVAVRPERVAVAAIPAEEMGDGALPATLIEVAPQGDHIRLRLLVGLPGWPLAELVVKRPAGVPLAGLAPGEPASIAWQPDHAHAFRAAPP